MRRRTASLLFGCAAAVLPLAHVSRCPCADSPFPRSQRLQRDPDDARNRCDRSDLLSTSLRPCTGADDEHRQQRRHPHHADDPVNILLLVDLQ
jgi:hypothetical protein